MGKKTKEHNKKIQVRNQKIKEQNNRMKKFYKLVQEEQQKTIRQSQLVQLVQKNIDSVRTSNPELFIANEDGTFNYNTELVNISETNEVTWKASGIPVFESYSEKQITAQQYLEIIADLTKYANTAPDGLPEVNIDIDEVERVLPEGEAFVMETVSKEDLA